jgi:hypothetical protein
MPVVAIIGTISPNPVWVSSSTRARPDNGACMAAPPRAAAQIMANAPDGEPGQVPGAAERAAEHRAGGQRRGEQPAGRAAAQAQGRDQRLEREQDEQQAEAADAEECVAGHVQAVAEQLRVPDADDAEDAEGERGANSAVVPRARRWETQAAADGSPLAYRRGRNHATPPNTPATSSEPTRRAAGACSTPCCRLPS